MILDKRNELADAVAVAGAAATRLVGDVIDLVKVRDIGNGEPVYLVVQVDVAPTGADTVEFILASDAQAAIAVDGSATPHFKTGAVAIASLPAGKRYAVALPREGAVYERFLGLLVTNVGAVALATLQVSAFLTRDPAGWKAYDAPQQAI